MYEHFKNIENLYGNAYVQIPNNVFAELSDSITSNGRTNIQQTSFAYAYIVAVAFLYKYAHFVDVDNDTYIQNSDIKQLLGYNKATKTIDKIIKRDGILENLGLVKTTKEYPVHVEYSDDKVNGMHMKEFTTINMLDRDDARLKDFKRIVKNRNYEIKEPVFLFEYDGDIGSLYNYERTHKITLKEFMGLIYDKEIDNIELLMYFFFKYKCYGLQWNTKSMALNRIVSELGMSEDTFYTRLNNLKKKNYIYVNHKGWKTANADDNILMESNDYRFIGIK